MSFLSETYLQDVRVNHPNAFDRTEHRGPERGLLQAAYAMSSGPNTLLTPDVRRKLAVSEGRVVEIPVMNKDMGYTVTAVRTCAISAGENTTAMLNVTYVTVVKNVVMTPAQYGLNEVDMIYDFQKKLVNVKESFEKAEEDAVLSRIETEKDSFYASPLVGAGNKYILTADAMQVPLANHEYFHADMNAIMKRDEFTGLNWVIAGTELEPFISKWDAQGTSNDENTMYQFADKRFTFTNAIDNAGTNVATGFIMPDGYLAIDTRLAADSRLRHKSTSGTEWGVTDILNMGHSVGYQYKSDCYDGSALNAAGAAHLTATLHDQWQFSYDFAIVTEYNADSTTRAGGLKKFEFNPA